MVMKYLERNAFYGLQNKVKRSMNTGVQVFQFVSLTSLHVKVLSLDTQTCFLRSCVSYVRWNSTIIWWSNLHLQCWEPTFVRSTDLKTGSFNVLSERKVGSLAMAPLQTPHPASRTPFKRLFTFKGVTLQISRLNSRATPACALVHLSQQHYVFSCVFSARNCCAIVQE